MRKFLNKFLGQLCIAAMLTGVASAADVDKKITDRIDSATAVVRELMATPDKGVPLWVAAKATCVLVVPGYKKGAFIVGGQYGQGLATCRNHHRWSAPVFVQITGASFGFQVGGQSTDLVLVGTNHKGMDDMLKEKVKLGGDIAASAGPVGRKLPPPSPPWPMRSSSPTHAAKASSPASTSPATTSTRTRTIPPPTTARTSTTAISSPGAFRPPRPAASYPQSPSSSAKAAPPSNSQQLVSDKGPLRKDAGLRCFS